MILITQPYLLYVESCTVVEVIKYGWTSTFAWWLHSLQQRGAISFLESDSSFEASVHLGHGIDSRFQTRCDYMPQKTCRE